MLRSAPKNFLIFLYMLLIRLLSDNISVMLLGGVWKVRKRANTHKGTILQKIFIDTYYAHLSKYCCWIGYTAFFESRPVLPHGFFGIFISRNAKIGKNCVMFPHVIIGSNSLPDSKRKGSPTIGNNVYIGAGASIIGNVRIGDNCRIGSNCIVTCDIPENSLVVMEKPLIIKKMTMNNKFYTLDEGGCRRYVQDGKKFFETDEKILHQLREIDFELEQKKIKM